MLKGKVIARKRKTAVPKQPMFEVERKYRVRGRHFGWIAAMLVQQRFAEVPTCQFDTYLEPPTVRRQITTTRSASGLITRQFDHTWNVGSKVTRRVRLEKSDAGVRYFLTDKIKSKIGPNTNKEIEREISQRSYKRYLKRVLTVFDMPLVVRKNRVHFNGKFKGAPVTICLDIARGPKLAKGSEKIKLGHFVEFETMVQDAEQIPDAHKLLKKLAHKTLPTSAKREFRGYRNMLIDAFKRIDRRRNGKAAKRSPGE